MTRHLLAAALAGLVLLCTAAAAPDAPEAPLADPTAEARARALMHESRCLVCQGESIAESGADLARDLRRLVREQVAAGRSDEQIRAYLKARYGDWILLRPPFDARTLVLWIGPPLLLLVLLIALFRRWRRAAGAAAAADEEALAAWIAGRRAQGEDGP